MLERFIQYVATDAPPADENGAATRERLKARFAPGATRRMTVLGMLVGATLPAEGPQQQDAIVYASRYGESPAMEQFLDSFPLPSPTLFQTSIHPSAIQQAMIGRATASAEFIPMTGNGELTLQAALSALLSPAPRVWWCGGEERGSWLAEVGAASDRSFAFTLALTRDQTSQALGRIAIDPAPDDAGELRLPDWFDLLHRRAAWSGPAATGWRLQLKWF